MLIKEKNSPFLIQAVKYTRKCQYVNKVGFDYGRWEVLFYENHVVTELTTTYSEPKKKRIFRIYVKIVSIFCRVYQKKGALQGMIEHS